MSKDSNINSVENIVCDVMAELEQAMKQHSPIRCPHEGYAVIKEELDELWDLIKKKNPPPSQLRKEAIQVAAMGVRFVLDLNLSECETRQKELSDVIPKAR